MHVVVERALLGPSDHSGFVFVDPAPQTNNLDHSVLGIGPCTV